MARVAAAVAGAASPLAAGVPIPMAALASALAAASVAGKLLPKAENCSNPFYFCAGITSAGTPTNEINVL